MSKYLEVYWAKTHNLKNIDVKIPKNKITVITWLSWSWKSSLAFNTIYSVWQQKYLESLSSYARMFIWWMNEEAEVSEIKWLSPTISIDQKTTSKNPRSTVGTITEIYDYYKLLFLNIWIRKCIECGNIIKKDSIWDILNFLSSYNIWTKFLIKSTFIPKKPLKDFESLKKEVLDLWFIRFSLENDDKIYSVNDNLDIKDIKKFYIVIDRLLVSDYSLSDSSDSKRLKDSLDLAFKVSSSNIIISIDDNNEFKDFSFSNKFVCSECSYVPPKLDISSFSFNSHSWACQECHWLWVKKVFLEENIINFKLTLNEWAIIAPWFWWSYFFSLLKKVWNKYNLNLDLAYKNLSQKEKDIVLYWTWDHVYSVDFENESWIKNTYKSKFEWVINTLNRRYYEWWNDKSHYEDFILDIDCPSCEWKRLNKESLNVYINDLNIWNLSDLSVVSSIDFLKKLSLSKNEEKIVSKVLKNALDRLEFLSWVWLDYISISRKSWTLSWWEAQRIRLATQIWTKLEWIIYVLDEPSIGLHPRDNNMLIDNLKKLRDIWNTLIIVEHDEDIMINSDHIIDIWPWAWIHWWNIVAQWNLNEIISNPKSITWPYLKRNTYSIIDRKKRKIDKFIKIIWATENNLKNIDVSIPLWNFVSVTWVSWSWKSSLVNDILSNYLVNKLNRWKRQVWKFKEIVWIENLDKTIVIDQSPIWKTPRSNPATYTWVLTPIREIFSMTTESQIRWYSPWRFSFNTRYWRCHSCDWDWVKKIEMHFLPPVYVECETCNWTRYNDETLEIKFRWKNIAEVLDMTIEEAIDFFSSHPKILKILKTMNNVWLWYLKLWQSSTTLSWWESQRIKLSTELSKRSTSKTFYILDEPTTGLHFKDVEKLLKILHSLVDKWNSVLVIEHNMDIILNSDYIIDIWPKWWDKWWEIVFCWTLEKIRKCEKSYTWEAINRFLSNNK